MNGRPAGETLAAAAAARELQQGKQQAQWSIPTGGQTTSSNAPAAAPASADSNSSSSSLLASSAAAAAVAAYRRQYLGLSTGQQPSGQQPSGSKPGFALKSRPTGMAPPDHGPQHRPGYLPRPDNPEEQAAVPNLPAKSGLAGTLLPPAAMFPGSCCPPPIPEPLVAMDPDAKVILAQRQSQRVLEPGGLMNRLVYDSLEPPATATASDAAAAVCFGSSCSSSSTSSASSSCRTTGSGGTTRSNSSVREDAAAGGTAAVAGSSDVGDSSQGAAPAAPAAWYVPQGPDDPTLVFESRFECGNLRRVVQVYRFEYDLVLQPDINTRGHTQWYYFSVRNMRPGQAYIFNIINLQKPDSLYNMGMLPLLHSAQQMRRKGIGWVRAGSDVYYGPNSIKRGKQQPYFALTFTMEFPHEDDTVHLAHCYPYSYSDLQNHLYVLLKEPSNTAMMQRACMATSLAGNAVDVLTITAPEGCGKPLSQRQGVVLSGKHCSRVHPGETNASWMMKGALHQLLGSSAEAAQLREQFVFKVVPMLNPDGVVVGNYRCSLAGLDLNRVWQEPDARLQPVICAFKGMIKAFMQEREVVLFVDMHGHSRKYGVFCYGCEKKAIRDSVPHVTGWPVPGSVGGLPGVPAKSLERLFPLMLYINTPDLFSFKSCNFKVQKSKAGTGRVVGFRELGLVNAYTIEASFCGASVGKYAKQHFNTGHLEDMGAALVRTLVDYWAPAELSSAAELSAQLQAAGSGSSGAAAAQSALGLVADTAGAAEDDDVCTDSDDESSSEEEKQPPQPQQSSSNASAQLQRSKSSGRLQVPVAPADAAGSAAAAAAAAAATAAAISSNVAQLSNQLVAMLAGTTIDSKPSSTASSSVVGADSTATSSGSAVASLLSAFKAASGSVDAPSGKAAGGSSSNSISTRRSSSRNAGSQQVQGSSSISSSSSSNSSSAVKQPNHAAALAAGAAAHALLGKLLAAKAKLQQGAAATGADGSAAGAAAAGTSSSSAAAAGAGAAAAAAAAAVGTAGSAGVVQWRSTAQQQQEQAAVGAVALTVSTAAAGCEGAGSARWSPASAGPGCMLPEGPGAATSGTTQSAAAAAGAGSAGSGPAQLSQEEAALVAVPGLLELLQQLVQEQAALTEAVGAAAAGSSSSKGTKKKGKRRGLARYGNPEVLRAARAKADASLAAALPELGSLLGFDDEDAAAANEGDVEDYSSAAAAPGSTTAPDGSSSSDWAGCIRSGRRANTAGSRGGALLDAERYMDLLDKQKRHTGGVLVSSSIDDPWAQCPSGSSSRSSRSAHTTSSFNSKGVPATPGAVAAAGLGSGSAQPPSGALGISRSSSLWAKADASPSLAAAVAAAAVIGGGGAGEPGQQSAAAATVASGAPAGIMGRRRRSKSAHAWFAN
uniref:Peptidase M14 domain-containing protein n=1 Tax=Tetradesmus obliquus TaxID=3088 RepID=A0A383WKG5_TETOB|eukprot:jgi/Sobl393_1/18304/SZX77901.1